MYFRELLQDRHSYATYMMALTSPHATIFRTGSGPGRRSTVGTPGEGSKIAPDDSMVEVHSMFQDIQLQAQGLQEKCTQVMAVISNSSMLAESQRAMKQAKLVTKLTVAAFVYLPFTFASGFFGMNFTQFGTGSLSLWIYSAASFPLLLVTLTFYALNKQSVRRGLQALRLMDAPKQD
ncbi:hypothetical protein NQ176_g8629 [Zarea fungicola]|uniref:Uncharacterized protein n=1 Tax=Zarea fungicola TaxID=93591 RepID=A0ACC1MR61_9HYPO|nr:hypothetical protein NQ176_g8629 [Lecanicillium fungicola]